MLTPEVQQYISQQRSAGVSDAQIRQTLATQGWQQADLDQTFGVAPVSPAVSQAPLATTKSYTKIIVVVLVVFVGLPILIWGSMLIFGYYTFTRSIATPSVSPSSLITPTPTSQTNSSSTSTGQKICGNWPATQSDNNYLTGAKFFSKITGSTTANGIPIYPSAVKIIETNTPAGNSTIQQVVACAKSTTILAIANYYKDLGGYMVADTASLPPAYSINFTLGSLKPIEIVDKSSGVLYLYDAGNGDLLLFYHYH